MVDIHTDHTQQKPDNVPYTQTHKWFKCVYAKLWTPEFKFSSECYLSEHILCSKTGTKV